MSTNATMGDKPNDGRIDDESTAETTPVDQHALGDEIAEIAPYARNDAPNSGDSL